MGGSFFYNFFIEPFTGGFFSALMCVLTWLTAFVIAGLLLFGIYMLVDSTGVDEKKGTGIVTAKWFEPAHTTTTYVNHGKTMSPIISRRSDAWVVNVYLDGATGKVKIKKEYWGGLKINQKINCTYKIGRLSKGIIITDMSL